MSGHPLLTTLGNSIRVYIYTLIVSRGVPKDECSVYICGDDVLILTLEKHAQTIVNEYEKMYASLEQLNSCKTETQYGLGQVKKMVNIGDKDKIDFLSKNYHYLGDSYVICTPPERFCRKMNTCV